MIAEIRGKEAEEDRLTSNVFETLRSLPPTCGILPFLERAERFDGDGRLNLAGKITIATYYFWPRTKNGKEPDLLILLERDGDSPLAILIEAKYRSGKHNVPGLDDSGAASDEEQAEDTSFEEVADTRGDQLTDYFAQLLDGNFRPYNRWPSLPSGAPCPKRESINHLLQLTLASNRFLIYLTAHYALPQHDVSETLDRLSAESRRQACQLFWLNWQALVPSLISVLKHDEAHLAERDRIMDVLSLLDRENLVPFDGFEALKVDGLTRHANLGLRKPFFWTDVERWFSGIKKPKIPLEKTFYFAARR
jgi:hypothetical protein